MDMMIQNRVSTILASNDPAQLDQLQAMMQKASPEEAKEITAALHKFLADISTGKGNDQNDIATPQPSEPGANQQALTQLGGISSSELGFDIYAVMAEFQKSAQEMRNTNREIRASELNAQVGSLMSAADEMKKAADFRLAAGITQGAMQMAAGVSSIVGSSLSMGKQIEANKAGKVADNATANQLQNAQNASKFLSAQGDAHSTRGDAAGKLLSGAGGIVSAGLEFAATNHDVAAKRFEAQGKLHESASQQANDMMQQMMDVIRDVRDKMQAIDQSRLETNRGIARNI